MYFFIYLCSNNSFTDPVFAPSLFFPLPSQLIHSMLPLLFWFHISIRLCSQDSFSRLFTLSRLTIHPDELIFSLNLFLIVKYQSNKN